MKYYLDCEFNGKGGELISLALVREDGASLYAVSGCRDPIDWVAENVLPKLEDCPVNSVHVGALGFTYGKEIAKFLGGDPEPVIIADWPDDIKYLCESLIDGSLYWSVEGGPMDDLPSLTFCAARVDAYPTKLEGAVQHNAWWDAMALRHLLTQPEAT